MVLVLDSAQCSKLVACSSPCDVIAHLRSFKQALLLLHASLPIQKTRRGGWQNAGWCDRGFQKS